MFGIGLVNYKSSVYLETQFKIYRDFAGEAFQIIIIDNSRNYEEFCTVKRIAKKFSIPIRIEVGTTKDHGSIAHGDSLQQAYGIVFREYPNIQYFLAQDPDFFWTTPNFLSLLKVKLEKFETVGPPYPYSAEEKPGLNWVGPMDFPADFGAVHKMNTLKRIKINFRPVVLVDGSIKKDVGWWVREHLMNDPYFSFEQEPFEPLGSYSFSMLPRRYRVDGKIVAYHLSHGTFEMHGGKLMRLSRSGPTHKKKLFRMRPPKAWQDNRKKMCDFFWQEINKQQGEV